MHSIRFTVILYSACRVPVRNVTGGLLYVNSITHLRSTSIKKTYMFLVLAPSRCISILKKISKEGPIQYILGSTYSWYALLQIYGKDPEKIPVILHVCGSPVISKAKTDVPSPRWVRFFTHAAKLAVAGNGYQSHAIKKRVRLPFCLCLLSAMAQSWKTFWFDLPSWIPWMICKWSSNASAGYFCSVLHQAV